MAIPFFLAVIGYGALDRPAAMTGPGDTVPTLTRSANVSDQKLSLAPISIARKGSDITLSGELPDDLARAALVKALNGSLPAGINIVDQTRINPNVVALAFFNSEPVFKDSASIPDFTMTVNADTITLTGTAGSQDQKSTIDSDAKRIWSNLNVVDRVGINGVPTPDGGTCADLQSAVNTATGGPITFGNDGFTLTPAEEQLLNQVAVRLKGCPSAHVTVNGYTDDLGNQATNLSSSTQRAQTVADYLTAHGVGGGQLVVKGLGSANAVAANDTMDGRAKNRRVELVVS
ncbi:channel-forming protein ArfA/OmpATb [Mycobacterium sp. Marseille-P9652]|uniref:channel-forming protein ArfA/OmpATb n=1 Tax=Mycobacterium sp. Marseille-P9652 TaxID=2654950 RepID=UPI001E59854A|nr:OmpA family protein [Mycobacterium sp. Marseille-P9652]